MAKRKASSDLPVRSRRVLTCAADVDYYPLGLNPPRSCGGIVARRGSWGSGCCNEWSSDSGL